MYDKVSTRLKIVFSIAVLTVTVMIVWVACVHLGYSVGNQPSNSDGDTCGFGNQIDRPLLLFYNIAQCDGLTPHDNVCNTKKICVKECPVTHWHSGQGGKPPDLKEFCENMTLQKFNTISMSHLVEQRLCPSYVVPSKPFQSRCLPNPDMLDEDKINQMKTRNGDKFNSENLLQGSKFMMDSLFNFGYVEDFLGSYNIYWVPIIAVLSFIFIWLMFLKPETSLIFYWVVSTGSILAYSPLSVTGPNNYWLLLILVMIVLVIINCGVFFCVWKSFWNIHIDSYSFKRILVHSFIFTVVVTVTLMNGRWLIIVRENGAPVYRVVRACPEERLINEATNEKFKRFDFCEPKIFNAKSACETAECVHYKFGHSAVVSLSLMVNPIVMFGMLLVIQIIQMQPRMAEDNSDILPENQSPHATPLAVQRSILSVDDAA